MSSFRTKVHSKWKCRRIMCRMRFQFYLYFLMIAIFKYNFRQNEIVIKICINGLERWARICPTVNERRKCRMSSFDRRGWRGWKKRERKNGRSTIEKKKMGKNNSKKHTQNTTFNKPDIEFNWTELVRLYRHINLDSMFYFRLFIR